MYIKVVWDLLKRILTVLLKRKSQLPYSCTKKEWGKFAHPHDKINTSRRCLKVPYLSKFPLFVSSLILALEPN